MAATSVSASSKSSNNLSLARYTSAIMFIDLARLTEDELLALNRQIVDRLHMIRSARQLVELARFSVGTTVEFTADDGRTIRGNITRLNRRTATICSAEAGHWR